MKLILGKGHCFVRITRPLIHTICQSFYDHAEAIPVKTDSFDTVPLVPAKQEQCTGLRVHVERVLHQGDESVDSLAEIGIPALSEFQDKLDYPHKTFILIFSQTH
jgi:hypothetical protein